MISSDKISIPKTFKLQDEIKVELKNPIKGHFEISGNKKVFIGAFPVFEINIENTNKSKIIKEIKDIIIEVYKRGIENVTDLNSNELIIFYNIKNIKYENKKSDTLIISIDDDIDNIKNIALKFNDRCDCFELNKNIELYMTKEYESLYKTFENKCKKNKYNKFIIDISNLYLLSDYDKTKKFIEYIEFINGRILFLIDHKDSSYDKFIKVFGTTYKDCVLDKMKYLYPEQSFILYKIEEILFK